LDDVTDALGPLETTVDYYYTVETTPDGAPDAFATEIESGILEGITDDVSLSGIGAITSSPPDSELKEFSCLPEVEGNNCYVYKGETTVLHDESADPADIEAAVLSSIEDTISSGELTSIDTVEKTTYLGDSLDDVTDALGPSGISVDGSIEKSLGMDGDSSTVASDGLGNAGGFFDLGDIDSDGDEISDAAELQAGTDPYNLDTDKDGLSDTLEATLGTDPLDAAGDLDEEGLIDAVEVFKYGTDPTNPDSDGDGLTDFEEAITIGTDPLDETDPLSKTSIMCPNTYADATDALDKTRTEVPFYYCVEATTDDYNAFLPELEARLLGYAAVDVLDCQMGQRRLLQLRAMNERRLEAVGISSSPEDNILPGVSCTPTKDPSNQGFVFEGMMTVVHDGDDDQEGIKSALLASVQETMESGDLENIETVERVTFLGSSVDDVYAAPGIIVEGVAASTSSTGTENPDDPHAESNGVLGAAVGITVAAAFILLLLLFIRRQRRSNYTEEEQAGADKGLGMELDEMSQLEDGWEGGAQHGEVSNYDNDEGSFHLGSYHYSKNGDRYLSKNCSVCAAIIAQQGGDLTVDSSFARADSKDLSKAHSAVDVHSCSSATCLHCANDGSKRAISFVKADGAGFEVPEVVKEEEEETVDETIE